MEYYKRAPITVNPVVSHPEERRIRLDGSWEFRLDPQDKGVAEQWQDMGSFTERIEVPGTWQGQGFGGDGKECPWNIPLPSRVFRATYTGTGWYARHFCLPQSWRGLRVWLHFGGVHPSAEIWLNAIRLGEHHAPFVPFAFEITNVVSFDTENILAVRVHEQAREMGLAFSYQGNWSGLYRGVELTATGQCFMESLWVYPDVDGERLVIRACIGGVGEGERPLTLRLAARPLGPNGPASVGEVPVTGSQAEFDLPVPSPRLWSPDVPNLYRVDALLTSDGETFDAISERVGFVKLSCRDNQFLINDQPYYIRGTGDFVCNPETGSPDTDRERWRRKLTALREYGYNQVRCQSYAPSPEYLDVADEVGLLVQSEMGMLGAWEGSFSVGHRLWHGVHWPQPMPGYREALKWQWDRVVMRDVNHPSANIYCMSNELGQRCLYPRIAWQCYHDTKAIKPTALVIWTDGGYNPDLPGDFVNVRAHTIRPPVEIPLPLIQHEFRFWVSYPDVRIIHKYSGAVRPFGAEIAFEAATRHGLAHILPQVAANSQRLQHVEAKLKIESCRRDCRRAGISHFMAMDLNMSPQGVLDEFYERKYVDSSGWLETNGDTVILASLGSDDRVLGSGETLRCSFSISDFSHPPLGRPALEWQFLAGNEVLGSGQFAYDHKPYLTCPAGQIEVTIPDVPIPQAARLQATLREGDRVFRNHWDLWLLPKEVRLPEGCALYGQPEHTWLTGLAGLPITEPGELGGRGNARVVLTERFDDHLVQFARTGGRVILAASEGLVRPFFEPQMSEQERYFFSKKANDLPFDMGHTGTVIAHHPMLGDLPHEGFADLHFFRLIGDSPPLDLAPLDLAAGEPVIRAVHMYPMCRPLAYLLERSLGSGLLIVCALKLDQSLPEGRYLLAQICDYAVSDLPRSPLELSADAVAALIAGTAIP